MKWNKSVMVMLLISSFTLFGQSKKLPKKITRVSQKNTKKEVVLNKLTKEESRVILQKGTESPFTGKFTSHKAEGFYTCKQCDAKLYSSDSKFNSHCGWPSFDDELPGAVKRHPDADGRRVEIVCAKCGGHLGHVFHGEKMTDKNTRHCVNSISMKFVSIDDVKVERAIFAAGCFWGVEFYLQQVPGVLSTSVGYIGGPSKNPSYKAICKGDTGHAEAVEVVFDPTQVNFETLAKLFFEIHDPTQLDGQGPDLGNQYRSEVFVINKEQREITAELIAKLKLKGFKVVTKVTDATKFWTGEKYHQDYYQKKGSVPYCHAYQQKFD